LIGSVGLFIAGRGIGVSSIGKDFDGILDVCV
jgi:hypothetical protein